MVCTSCVWFQNNNSISGSNNLANGSNHQITNSKQISKITNYTASTTNEVVPPGSVPWVIRPGTPPALPPSRVGVIPPFLVQSLLPGHPVGIGEARTAVKKAPCYQADAGEGKVLPGVLKCRVDFWPLPNFLSYLD